MLVAKFAVIMPAAGKSSEQAASSTIDVEKVQKAFDNIYATMDAIDTCKA